MALALRAEPAGANRFGPGKFVAFPGPQKEGGRFSKVSKDENEWGK